MGALALCSHGGPCGTSHAAIVTAASHGTGSCSNSGARRRQPLSAALACRSDEAERVGMSRCQAAPCTA
eukprot:8113344-Lingulodinium_polyedra.AAC.1